MRWALRAAPVVIAVILAAEYFSTPRPNSERALLAALSGQLRFNYHECVPIGWKPVAVAGSYYPGYTASVQTYAEWLDAIWRGRIETRDLRDADAYDVYTVLNHLVSAGLLVRRQRAQGYDYFSYAERIPVLR